MNPFQWSPWSYALFYVAAAVVISLVARIIQRRRELEDTVHRASPIGDPYLIALLRGGSPELLRVAIVSLIERGLLTVDGDAVQTTDAGRRAKPGRRIERQLLEFFEERRESREVFASPMFDATVAEDEAELARMHLMPTREVQDARWRVFRTAAVVLLCFPIARVFMTLVDTMEEIIFLAFLPLGAIAMLLPATLRRRTAGGDAFLGDVRNLFQSLKLRAPQFRGGGATPELVMLAAVWGVAILPKESFPWVRELFPKAADAGAGFVGGGESCDAGGSSCGTGCGGAAAGCGGAAAGCGGAAGCGAG